MGALTLRVSVLCLLFFHIQIFQMEIATLSIIFLHANIPDKMKKKPVELGENGEEGESESEVINQLFGRLHPVTSKK